MGVSAKHASSASTVRNTNTHKPSPQFHCVHDDHFDTIHCSDTKPPDNWEELVVMKSFCADLNEEHFVPGLDEEWLNGCLQKHSSSAEMFLCLLLMQLNLLLLNRGWILQRNHISRITKKKPKTFQQHQMMLQQQKNLHWMFLMTQLALKKQNLLPESCQHLQTICHAGLDVQEESQ